MSKPAASMQACIGTNVSDWAKDCTTYSGSWMMSGRLSVPLAMYLSMADS